MPRPGTSGLKKGKREVHHVPPIGPFLGSVQIFTDKTNGFDQIWGVTRFPWGVTRFRFGVTRFGVLPDFRFWVHDVPTKVPMEVLPDFWGYR